MEILIDEQLRAKLSEHERERSSKSTAATVAASMWRLQRQGDAQDHSTAIAGHSVTSRKDNLFNKWSNFKLFNN